MSRRMNRPMNRRILSICALLLSVVSLGTLPAAAQEGVFVRPLLQPLAGQPFELFFAGYWINYFDPPTPQPVVTVEENVISVRVDAFAFPILPPASSYAFGAPVDGLPAGEYEVRLFVDDGPHSQATYAITVRDPRLEVEVLEAPRLAGETARILIRGLTRCPEWPEGAVVDGSVIYLPEAIDCVADPPHFFERTFTTPPLEAGDYDVYAVQAGQEGGYSPDDALGFAKLRVDPRPMLQGGRFAVDVAWQDFKGKTGVGRPVASPTDQSALLWFFGPNNWEMMVKILDGCSINDHYWIYSAASTNVGYDLTITDSVVGGDWSYSNALGTRSPAQADVEAFPCATEPSSADLGSSRALSTTSEATTSRSTTSKSTTFKAFGFSWVGPIAFEPGIPNDSQPVTLHLVGSWPTNGQPLPAVESVRVDAADQRVVVALSGPPTGCVLAPPFLCTPGHDYAFSVDLGRLDAGPWELEVVHAEPDVGETPISTSDFYVYGGYEIVAPRVPVTDLEPVELLVRGVESCPSIEVDSIGEDLIELRVVVCPIGVPPTPAEFEIPLLLDLGPGSYRVVLRGPYGDEIVYEADLEVVGLPVPLGDDGRYVASVTWTDFKGLQGIGRPAVKPSEDSALFWFFGPENWELMIKVLEACNLNGHVWVYGAASTNVAYELRVVDTVTGIEWSFENPLGQRSDAITDVEAFVCD